MSVASLESVHRTPVKEAKARSSGSRSARFSSQCRGPGQPARRPVLIRFRGDGHGLFRLRRRGPTVPAPIDKVALFIRAFVRSGYRQMQPDTLNVDTLRDAQRHPERHWNLVVPARGWSGHFCELNESYQSQIIGRHIHGARGETIARAAQELIAAGACD